LLRDISPQLSLSYTAPSLYLVLFALPLQPTCFHHRCS
jgi:hypothetical protein